MADLDRIRAVKAQASERLLAIPGVHSVAIGAKKVGGEKTAEPAIVVFVTSKKPLGELTPQEVIPAEIDGVKTDVVEEEMPRLFGLPDTDDYKVLDGGIQIQAGTTVTGVGTLGCIARTDDPQPKIVALTCQHVVAVWSSTAFELKSYTSPDQHEVIVYGANVTGVRVRCFVTLVPAGAGATQFFGPFDYVTVAADTPVTIASNVAGLINAAASPNFNATAGTADTSEGTGGKLNINSVGAFNAQLQCEVDPIWATLTGTKTVTFSGIVRAGFMAVVHIVIIPIPSGDFQYLDIFYTCVAADTLNSIATNVANRINALANPGVTATGPATAAATNFTIASGPNTVASIDDASMYSAMIGDKDSKLHAVIAGNVISFSGRVAGDDYGIYTTVNAGGAPHSFGVFMQPGKNTPLGAIASSIAGNLSTLGMPGVTAVANAEQITVNGAQEIECAISSDIRVGQAVHDFGSSCSHCCSKRIGRLYDARLDIDTAVVLLDPGKKYKNEVEQIGVVTGTHAVDDNDVMNPGGYPVKKRGRTTGLTTNGTVDYLHADGNIGGVGVFHRHYTEAIKITGARFSAPGDSGSAVLNAASEVIGLLFGGGTTTTYVTPIQTIESELDVVVESATAANDVKTVPAPTPVHQMTMLPESAVATAATPPTVQTFDWDRLQETQQQIAATPVGSDIMEAVRKHIPETQELIRTNRKFAAAWRRYGGPLIVQAVLRMALARDQPLPRTIKGRPLPDCLGKIHDVLVRCASAELCHDVARYRHRIEASLTLTYPELIASLHVSGQE
jgi:hypothetical protein